jgi:hypothetical protein
MELGLSFSYFNNWLMVVLILYTVIAQGFYLNTVLYFVIVNFYKLRNAFLPPVHYLHNKLWKFYNGIIAEAWNWAFFLTVLFFPCCVRVCTYVRVKVRSAHHNSVHWTRLSHGCGLVFLHAAWFTALNDTPRSGCWPGVFLNIQPVGCDPAGG